VSRWPTPIKGSEILIGLCTEKIFRPNSTVNQRRFFFFGAAFARTADVRLRDDAPLRERADAPRRAEADEPRFRLADTERDFALPLRELLQATLRARALRPAERRASARPRLTPHDARRTRTSGTGFQPVA
jgi:hypothetical protein